MNNNLRNETPDIDVPEKEHALYKLLNDGFRGHILFRPSSPEDEFPGDIIPTLPSDHLVATQFPFIITLHISERWKFSDLLYPALSPPFRTWWHRANKAADGWDKDPLVLFTKGNQWYCLCSKRTAEQATERPDSWIRTRYKTKIVMAFDLREFLECLRLDRVLKTCKRASETG